MRIAAAVSRMRRRSNEVSISMADLNAMIRDFERLFRSVVGAKVPLRTALEPRLGPVQCDPAKIGSLVVHLLMRARDISPAGAEISVTTLNADLDQAAAAALHLSPGAYVTLEVVVNGQMEAPAKVREILEEARGAVVIRDGGAQGSSLTVVLPRITAEAMSS
jgi:signal transduction histidine kinase